MCRSCFGICQNGNVSAVNASVTTTDNWSSWFELLLLLSRLVIVFFILFGNILVITTITKTKLFHSYNNFLLLNLSISDLMVGLGLVSETIYSLLAKEKQKLTIGALIIRIIIQTGIVSSLYTVLIISWERYRGITKPIRVRTEQKGLKLKLVLFFLWFLAVVGRLTDVVTSLLNSNNKNASNCVDGWNSTCLVADAIDHKKVCGLNNFGKFKYTSVLFIVISYALPMSIMCYSYIRTVCLLWSQKKNFATNTHQSLIKSRERITKLLGMVIVAFTFTSLPFYATFIAYSFLGNNVGEPILQVLLNLLFSGSCINPLLYWFHNRKFREVAKRMLRCKT